MGVGWSRRCRSEPNTASITARVPQRPARPVAASGSRYRRDGCRRGGTPEVSRAVGHAQLGAVDRAHQPATPPHPGPAPGPAAGPRSRSNNARNGADPTRRRAWDNADALGHRTGQAGRVEPGDHARPHLADSRARRTTRRRAADTPPPARAAPGPGAAPPVSARPHRPSRTARSGSAHPHDPARTGHRSGHNTTDDRIRAQRSSRGDRDVLADALSPRSSATSPSRHAEHPALLDTGSLA